jgi:hypothetical protein
MSATKKHKVSALLLGVVAALLLLASPAAAEVRTGQGTSPPDGSIPGEADILSGNASYDSSTGTVNISLVTREVPGSHEVLAMGASLGVQSSFCAYPSMTFGALTNSTDARWFAAESEAELVRLNEEGKLVTEPAAKGGVGTTTTTFSVTSPRLVGKPYNCAEIEIHHIVEGQDVVYDELTFPIAAPAPPPPPPPTPPTPAPAALTIGASKPVKARVGKWTKVNVQIANPGGITTGAIGLNVKAPAGIKLKPGTGKVGAPALAPGATETVSFKVKPTRKAKGKSTLKLSAASGGLGATGAVVVKAIR